jgi:predicted ATP-dependent serine protease
VYGFPGIGKSEAVIREINRRKLNGEFIFYVHLREYCSKMASKLKKSGVDEKNIKNVSLTYDIP